MIAVGKWKERASPPRSRSERAVSRVSGVRVLMDEAKAIMARVKVERCQPSGIEPSEHSAEILDFCCKQQKHVEEGSMTAKAFVKRAGSGMLLKTQQLRETGNWCSSEVWL